MAEIAGSLATWRDSDKDDLRRKDKGQSMEKAVIVFVDVNGKKA